jgi:precorrin-2 dehydrogenase / sirohydrochlorin ferrochelatase
MSLMIDLQPWFGRALVVGGGQIAARKVRTLTEAEFEVTVVAPDVLDEIRTRPFVTVVERPFQELDLDLDVGFALVFACTNDRETNEAIGVACRLRRIPVLVADAQDESTFFTPAVLRDGDLAVAVSTGGASPTLAKELRERIAAAIGPGWDQAIRRARAERELRLGRKDRAAE